MTTFINYGSESVDVAIECRNYLLENNYFENQEIDNLNLLENALINFSVIKLLCDWKLEDKQLEIENWDSLPALLNAINNQITTEEERSAFFAQYTHCILQLSSSIQKREPINWINKKDSPYNINVDDYCFTIVDGKIQDMITSEDMPPHEIPIVLLNKLKSYYPQKKNPVLEK